MSPENPEKLRHLRGSLRGALWPLACIGVQPPGHHFPMSTSKLRMKRKSKTWRVAKGALERNQCNWTQWACMSMSSHCVLLFACSTSICSVTLPESVFLFVVFHPILHPSVARSIKFHCISLRHYIPDWHNLNPKSFKHNKQQNFNTSQPHQLYPSSFSHKPLPPPWLWTWHLTYSRRRYLTVKVQNKQTQLKGINIHIGSFIYIFIHLSYFHTSLVVFQMDLL